jgi:DedD protein
MSGEDELLLRRLIGAAVVFISAFLLAWLLPQPEAGNSEEEGTVVLRMGAPEPAPRLERAPRAAEVAEASVRSGERAASGAREASVETPPDPARVSAAVAEPAPEPKPKPKPESKPEPRPKAAPEPEPHAAEATVAGGGDWWIQAAAYSDQAAARRGRERVEEAFSTGSRLREVRVDGRRFWRLQVGPLPREAAAQALAEGLREKGFQGARVFRETGP